MLQQIQKYGRPFKAFHVGMVIQVHDTMTPHASYTLTAEPGILEDTTFTPYLTPGEMLALGAFEGKYLNDCVAEFPAEWFLNALAFGTVHPDAPHPDTNRFAVKSRQSLQEWRKKGWVPGGARGTIPLLSSSRTNPDVRGWFQWYCRYWMGRRIPELDAIQIRRWKAFTRHAGQIRANCRKGDLSCRPVQRQALLQWAHNPFL